MKPCFALVDCNNFYASCETLFRPDLQGKPVIVLSNNDGCVVARSQEAKALGIKIGQPVFQVQDVIRYHQVAVFSSNYALYADLSARVMQTLTTIAPQVEVYSIDEAFLDLSGIDEGILSSLGQQIRETIYQVTGITTCVGIAPTKTLAKLANHAAKQYPATKGVVVLLNKERQQRLMQLTPIHEVWGVGPRLTQKLQTMNIDTAWQLATANPALLRKKYSVVLERTARELNGVCCLALEDITLPKQQIVCSRSFGQQITAFNTLRSAVCEYMARAAEKLRAQRQLTKHITIFIQTSRFQMENHYANSACTRLIKPTDDTRVLIKKATLLLQAIWKDGYCYNKAGVVLADFFDPTAQQGDFFEQSEKMKSTSLMAVVDTINASTGKLFLAAQGVKSVHTMHQSHRSPAYTTNWKSLPTVR